MYMYTYAHAPIYTYTYPYDMSLYTLLPYVMSLSFHIYTRVNMYVDVFLHNVSVCMYEYLHMYICICKYIHVYTLYINM